MSSHEVVQSRKETHKSKTDKLWVYLLISVFFMDTIFRYTTINEFELIDTLISFLFISTYVLVIYLIATFFKGITNLVITATSLIGLAIIYSSQLIYYQFFKSYYSVYSVGKAEVLTDFWSDIGTYLLKNAHWILLLFLPVIMLIVLGKSYFSFKHTTILAKGIIVVAILVSFFLAKFVIFLNGKDQHAAYDLYYQSNNPLLSVQRLGLLTSMRIDLQRYITNWSPELAELPEVVDREETDPEKTDESESGSEQEKEEDADEKDKEYDEYNVLDIDFDQLIADESNDELKQMHEFFADQEPTKKNDYTGKYEGYNLILLTGEAFSTFAIDEELTPTLYKMFHEGYQFPNFYTPIWEVSTSDGEYVALNSLLPKSGVWSLEKSGENSLPFALGNQLQSIGYQTNAYHNHTYTYYGRDISHPNLGYDYKGLGNGLDVEETWPESDVEMMEKTVDEYINNKPFHAYYMTVSGHMQYSFTGNYIALKNKDLVDHLSLSDQAKAYLATQIELDRALEYLLDRLEEAGVADKTLIALSSDHYPYGLDDETIDELLGHPVEENFELYENTFILYTKDMEPETVTKQASSLDILPTISNLLGLEYDSRLMMGRDIFSDATPLIPFLNKSFITDQGMYNSESKEFTSFEDEKVDEEYIDEMSAIIDAMFYYSTKILDTDYYQKLPIK